MRVWPVLVRPRYAGNVGSVVRVAANFGAERVTLVDPECSLEEPDLVRMAMGADRVVRVEVVPELAAAVVGADAVIATTSGRNRDPRGLGAPAEVRERVLRAGAASAALVFGSERGGLSNEELRRCEMLLTIPANPDFPVLNLAQAVGIVLAAFVGEDFSPAAPSDPLDAPAPPAEFAQAVEHVQEVLLASGFLNPENPSHVMDQLRRVLGRAVPTRREVAILRGIASHIAYLHGRSRPTR